MKDALEYISKNCTPSSTSLIQYLMVDKILGLDLKNLPKWVSFDNHPKMKALPEKRNGFWRERAGA